MILTIRELWINFIQEFGQQFSLCGEAHNNPSSAHGHVLFLVYREKRVFMDGSIVSMFVTAGQGAEGITALLVALQ